MLPFKLVYSDDFHLPIGEHVFPAQKYRLVHQHLIASGIAAPEDFVAPQAAADEDVLLVHGNAWVDKLRMGTLSAREELQLEVPYSRELVDKFWLAAGGSILAARRALEDKVGINIGGGFHHAFPDHGEGFCLIHDVAIAIRRLQKDKQIARAMTVDCDVHQGNGTAAIFGSARVTDEPLPSWSASMFAPPRPASMRESPTKDVFTISLHQENNYPAWKPPSSIDVNLPDGTGDEEYLDWLVQAIGSALQQFQPDLICYIAGADAYREDQLGGLGLTINGLKRRDELVFQAAKARGIPVMVTLAGGYAFKIEDTVTIHANTVLAAKEVYASADVPAKVRS
jgi:acetoin utilization deacetylase AcuC-like enzyme